MLSSLDGRKSMSVFSPLKRKYFIVATYSAAVEVDPVVEETMLGGNSSLVGAESKMSTNTKSQDTEAPIDIVEEVRKFFLYTLLIDTL